MNQTKTTNWSLFKILCRILGGQDNHTLADSVSAGLLPQLLDMARVHDVLPALAVRYNEHFDTTLALQSREGETLAQALRKNTLRNMKISAQALKLTRTLNNTGITPLFLKGTVQLLAEDAADIGFRQQVDIDFLVERAHLESASDALLADGYRFYQFPHRANRNPGPVIDTRTAVKLGAIHHHLPPLAKDGYDTTVELHSHFLPKRFQDDNPLAPLFATAILRENRSARFLIPSTEHSVIQLILGKLVNDGHLTRRTFPLREACDIINLLNSAKSGIDQTMIEIRCGKKFALFYQLVVEFMAYTPAISIDISEDISNYIQIMRRRQNSAALSTLLDTYARAQHLTSQLTHNPEKLPAYLRRLAG